MPILPKKLTSAQTTTYTNTERLYSSFFDIGMHVIYIPRSMHCKVIEKYYKRYKLQSTKYEDVIFEANEDQVALFAPKDKPSYLEVDK